MNRVDTIFNTLRASGQKALMPFITAGDPDLATTAAMLPALEKAGASIVELGFPFSDPIADGPVIQASMTHALAQGVRPGAIFDMAKAHRQRLNIALVAMVSYTLVHRIGVREFARRAAAVGIDGLIVPDLTLEESAPMREAARNEGLVCSFLIAPNTPIERAKEIAQASSGFIYLLARSGITGERSNLPPDLGERVEALRGVTDLPIAVGFGIAQREQVQSVVEVADAAIVGSAIMRRVADLREEGAAKIVRGVAEFVSDLAEGLRQKL
ncbi:MAG: tryptophan synthase subunit alpha [Phycisphaera sp.]|nr:tryptophan synthase subunit alpha [Phycisphaera sp.]